MGYDVSIPLTESAAYDLVIDDGHQLVRVQCKYANDRRRQVDLRNIHSNSSGYVVKRVRDGSYDWLYVLDGNGAEYVIKECLSQRRSVTLRNEDKIEEEQRRASSSPLADHRTCLEMEPAS